MELILPEDACSRRKLVEIYQLYLDLLGRPPDKLGLFNGCQAVERGASIVDIRDGITGSEEYRRRQEDRPVDAIEARRSAGAASGLDVLGVLFDGAVPASNRTAYRWWVDELHERRRRAAERDPAAPDGQVVFILPLAEGHAGEALQTIASVLGQHDPRWHMIVVAGTFTIERAVRNVTKDRRITIIRGRPRIAASIQLRSALLKAGAAIACLLGPGEMIADIAVADILSVRDGDIVLSDGDTRDEAGRWHSPNLTGRWDPDIALIREPAGLVGIRASALHKVWQASWARASSPSRWEALLCAASMFPADRIRHLPAMLLHRPPRRASPRPRRSIVTTFLQDVQAAPSAALVDQACGRSRVVYPLPRQPPLVSVIVATRDQPRLLKNCAEGVLGRTDYGPLELIIVDNDSVSPAGRDTLARLSRDPRVTVVRETIAFHWGKLNVAGIRASKGEILVFLNDDIDVVDTGWLRELVSQASRWNVGLVGAKLLYPSGDVQHAGIVLDVRDAIHVWRHAPGDYAGYEDQLASCRTVSAVTGACVAMTRKVYDEIGGFEDEHLAVTWGDIDLCLRVRRRGYRIIWTPHAVLHHVEQATRGPDTTPETQRRTERERAYMRTEWGAWIETDPYFSPNLNPATVSPTLRTSAGCLSELRGTRPT